MKACSPENLVGHPVADPGKSLLHQEHPLDWCAGATGQERFQPCNGEGIRSERRWNFHPPCRLRLAVMEKHAAKLSRIRKHKRAFPLAQDYVIVLARSEVVRFDPKLTRHPQMNAQPPRFRESKQHLLAPCLGANQLRAEEGAVQRIKIVVPEDSLFRVEFNSEHAMTKPHIPSATMVLHFGKFRH